MAHSVFISYSSKDKKVADAVCATLENRKIRCWIAPRDAISGIPYAEALIKAINSSSILVLVFSASANQSPQVMREVERAVNKGIPIIPFRIENVLPSGAMEYYLSAPHWLDAVTPPLEKHLHNLAGQVQALLTELEKALPEDKEKAPAPDNTPPKASPKRRKIYYTAAGVIITAAIIVGIVLAAGGSGDDGQDPGGLIANPPTDSTSMPTTTASGTPSGTIAATTPGSTVTSSPDGTTSPSTTTTPPSGTTSTPVSGTSQVGTPLVAGSSLQNELTFPGEVHWYSFDAEAGDSVYLLMLDSTPEGTINPWLGLIGPDGKILYEDDGWPNYQNVEIYYTIKQGGKYTVRVRDKELGTGLYTLSFSQASVNGSPITAGSFQKELVFPGEAHWYTFDAKAGDSIYVLLVESERGGPMNPWLVLLDAAGTVIFDDDGWPDYASVQLDYTFSESGKYILLVRDKNFIGGIYTLSFNILVVD